MEVQNGAKAIFEGAFLIENVVVRVDILVRNSDDSFDLIEVKGSTKFKEKEHLPDCGIQAYVLQQSGIRLRNICIAYLNNDYVREGDINLSNLFHIETIDDALLERELKDIPEYLSKINKTLASNEEPYREIGSICKNPDCEFKHYCWKDVSEKSIHYLYRIRDGQRSQFISENIELVSDIPESYVKGGQRIQVVCEQKQESHIEKQKIEEHITKLKYPLYFLDFETISYPIPRYNGTRPFQNLPFQYSLHVQFSPDSPLDHYEFLFEQNENPMRAIAERLALDLGNEGSIIVYHQSFEKKCLEELSDAFLDISLPLKNIISRLWDLEEIFAKKWFYDPKFNGSSSIKKVLPALVPDLTYKNLAIQKGDDAQAMYSFFINNSFSISEREKIKNDILEYCKLDTLAMVRILAEVQKFI